MRRQPVVVALVAGVLALLGPATAPVAAVPAAPAAPAVPTALASPDAADVAGALAAPGQEVDDGLTVRADAKFVVDPDSRQIHVTTAITLTNTKADTRRGDIIEQHYFSRYDVPVLSEAANVRAVLEGGSRLPVNVTAAGSTAQQWVKYAQITLQPHLLFNETQKITLSYDLPYREPRSTGLIRANDALVTFPAFAPGDAGMTTIEVRLPASFAVEVAGDTLDQQEQGDEIVLTSGPIDQPELFTATVVATDDDQLVSRSVQVDDRTVDVRAWPDDTEWGDFIAERLGAIMPALDQLVGQPWPTERGLAVIETGSPYAHGYAGWYDQVDHSISLGDELDSVVVAHELSHVWFNANLFEARWINEGLANEYAETTMRQVGEQPPGVTAPDRNGDAAVPLNDWGTPSLLEQQDEATETYGYAASWYVMDQIAAEIGVDKMRAVIDAVADDRMPYLGDPDPENVHGVANWKRLLDQFENVGGSQRATELFGQYVVDDSDKTLLATRTEARGAYEGLAERGGGWTPPLAVRVAMSDWKFGDVGPAVIQANGVLDLRDEIDEALAGLGIDHLALEDDYESARDLVALSNEAGDTLDAARAYRDAHERRDEGPGLVGTIGLLGTGTDDRLDDAADALDSGHPERSLAASAAVEDRLDGATRNGLLRLAGLVVLLVLVGVGVERRWGRPRRQGKARQAEIDQLEALYAGRTADAARGSDALWRPMDRPMDPDHPN
jgi:hypothetical protein